MRILHVISSLEIGGAQKLLSELLPALKRQGDEVELLVYKRNHNYLEKRIEDAGIRIRSLDADRIRSLDIIPTLRKAIKGYDRVHVHLFPVLYQAAIAAMGTNQKLYYTEHSTTNRRRNIKLMKTIEKNVYGRYRRIVAISDATRDSLVGWLGEKHRERVVTIENGLNLGMLRGAEPSPQFPNQRYVLMVSRFVPSKDQETLIRAIPLIKDKDILFFFAGDGETLEKCHALARRKGVENRCVFLGNRDDVPQLMAGSVMGVQASKWEGFGLTAAEFMAVGKPVLGSDVEGLRDVIGDRRFLFEAGNHRQLAALIDRTLENPELPETDLERFDIDRMAAQYRTMYLQ